MIKAYSVLWVEESALLGCDFDTAEEVEDFVHRHGLEDRAWVRENKRLDHAAD